MSRDVTLVLIDAGGAVLGVLAPYPVDAPWWQEAADVVEGARDRYGVEVTLLRLLAAGRSNPLSTRTTRPTSSGGCAGRSPSRHRVCA